MQHKVVLHPAKLIYHLHFSSLCHISENIDIAAGSDPIIVAVLILIINLVVMEEKHYVPAGAAAPIYCCRASLPGEASNISEKTFYLDSPSFAKKKRRDFIDCVVAYNIILTKYFESPFCFNFSKMKEAYFNLKGYWSIAMRFFS